MTYSVTSPLIGKTWGTLAEALSWLDMKSGPETEYATELWRLCQLVSFDFSILFSQSAHETGDFSSFWWQSRKNPAGIGITGDKAQNEASQDFKTGTGAARAHVAHMIAYTYESLARPKHIYDGHWTGDNGAAESYLGTRPLWIEDVRFYHAVREIGGTVRTINDLTGKWAVDPNYAAGIVRKANAIFSNHTEDDVAIVAKPCPIEIDVLTGPMNNRPALAMPDASFVTVHEVGNTTPGADEDMHARFVHNGGGEGAVSFHFVVGPTKAIQLVYLNENAWHASDYYSGRGNRDSWAIETIQIGDFNLTLSHLAWLIAELYRNPIRFKYRSDVAIVDDLPPALAMERTKQHNFWAPDHKNCPQFIRDRGLWLPLLGAVQSELANDVPDIPKWTVPIVPSWWSEQALIDLRMHREDGVLYKPLGARITAIKETGAYAHPWLPEAKGKRTRANIKVGDTVDLRYVVKHPTTGEQWGISRYGSWLALKYFTPSFTIRTRETG